MNKFIVVLLALGLASFTSANNLYFRPSKQQTGSVCSKTCGEGLSAWCCPHAEGVCCKDGKSCCPSGSRCFGNRKCLSPLMFPVLRAFRSLPKSHRCPDKSWRCPRGGSCLQTAPNRFHCCPFHFGSMCSSGRTCCPQGMRCDARSERCLLWNLPVTYAAVMRPASAQRPEVKASRLCPDHKDRCREKQTCCKMTGNDYGCCPYQNATCCGGSKCCPANYRCDMAYQRCSREFGVSGVSVAEMKDLQPKTVPWMQKVPAKKTSRVSDIICGDGKSTCADDQTCCRLKDGSWGCCPAPNASCCPDGEHCCLFGFKCTIDNRCVGRGPYAFLTVPRLRKVPAKTVSVAPAIKCGKDGKYTCKKDQTCCRMKGGSWGCCPSPKASCCPDGIHCCRHGFKCTKNNLCVGNGLKIPLMRKVPAKKTSGVSDIKCGSDGKYTCADGQTCCQLSDGSWGCCPLPKATCCSDGEHCCPNGYTCSGTHCVEARTVPLMRKVPVKKTSDVSDIKCKDGKSTCADGQTCCLMKDGSWGCCPAPKASCCPDGEHCCPNGFKCTIDSRCVGNGLKVPLMRKVPAKKTSGVSDIKCGSDGKYTCADGQTCCQLSDGSWGCCPIPKATCCSDGEHCCPNGYTCSGTHCVEARTVPLLRKVPAKKTSDVSDIKCKDGKSTCADGQTCCLMKDGSWGCCPVPKATCCSDHEHCCPNGYTCSGTHCVEARTDPLLRKVPAKKTSGVSDIKCGSDGKYTCADGQTCCQLSDGSWGCCPTPKATCCSDGEHCCPNGYTCSGTHCVEARTVPLMRKVPAKKTSGTPIIKCGDGFCANDQTCCQRSDSTWGCCPLENAVCCKEGGGYCCPEGQKCAPDDTCVPAAPSSVPWLKKAPSSVPWLKKRPAKGWNGNLPASVKCNASEVCPDGNTCCRLLNGNWGCCPLLEAVCCSDGEHCCPQGTTCDLSTGTCDSRAAQSALRKLSAKASVLCPGSSHSCPSGSTCCPLPDGSMGCCLYQKAVCCQDHIHCCPSGYSCDLTHGSCVQEGSGRRPSRQLQLRKVPGELPGILCPDKSSSCASGQTCCLTKSGFYGCCPVPNAVCCSDREHCCPAGTLCDSRENKCVSSARLQITKGTALQVVRHNIICPDHMSECPVGQTCCKIFTGSYGCCPAPNAVCCADGLHCCPHGSKCDPASGSCKSTSARLPRLEPLRSVLKPRPVRDIICPGGEYLCPSNTTCCQLPSGIWGCCDFPQAVCCSDGYHCCPQGYVCDLKAAACVKPGLVSPVKRADLSLRPARVTASNLSLCPNKKSVCYAHEECCSQGCCPYAQGVCCANSGCCPEGYSCDLATMSCKGLLGSPPMSPLRLRPKP